MSTYSRRVYESRKLRDNLAWFPQKFLIGKPRQIFSLLLLEECPLFPSFKTGFKPFRIHILLKTKGAD
jgi:hypothetical protein